MSSVMPNLSIVSKSVEMKAPPVDGEERLLGDHSCRK